MACPDDSRYTHRWPWFWESIVCPTNTLFCICVIDRLKIYQCGPSFVNGRSEPPTLGLSGFVYRTSSCDPRTPSLIRSLDNHVCWLDIRRLSSRFFGPFSLKTTSGNLKNHEPENLHVATLQPEPCQQLVLVAARMLPSLSIVRSLLQQNLVISNDHN